MPPSDCPFLPDFLQVAFKDPARFLGGYNFRETGQGLDELDGIIHLAPDRKSIFRQGTDPNAMVCLGVFHIAFSLAAGEDVRFHRAPENLPYSPKDRLRGIS